MSLELVDGFDHYSISNMPEKGWIISAGSPGMTTGRFGGQAFFCGNGGIVAFILPGGSLATRTIGFAFQPGGATNSINATPDILRLNDGGTATANVQIQVITNSGGFLQVYRGVNGLGGTLLGTASTMPLLSGLWYYIEVQATIGGSGTVKINVSDGVSSTTVLNLAGVNTQNTANANFNYLWWGANLKNSIYDDLYVATPAGAVNNSFLGECRIQTIYATGDGHLSQWTPNSGTNHFSRVNETLVDNDSSYVSSATPGQIDSFTHAALATSGGILGVQTNIVARKDDVSARSIAANIYNGTTDFTNANSHGLFSAYADYLDIYENDPSTSSPWNVAGFNAREIGVNMIS